MADINSPTNFNSSGVKVSTPQNIMLGAGTIHKGLYRTPEGVWNLAETLVGATSGGSKLTITPNIFTPELDNVLVKVKGLDFKQGETAKLEINFAEITADLLKTTIFGTSNNTVSMEDFELIESKPDIANDDYWENVAFVGCRTDGKKIIVILDNAICTSGLELEGKNKDSSKPKLTFECSRSIEDEDFRTLPYHIYYPV